MFWKLALVPPTTPGNEFAFSPSCKFLLPASLPARRQLPLLKGPIVACWHELGRTLQGESLLPAAVGRRGRLWAGTGSCSIPASCTLGSPLTPIPPWLGWHPLPHWQVGKVPVVGDDARGVLSIPQGIGARYPLLRASRSFLFLQITVSLRCTENERINILSKPWRDSSSLPNQKIPAFCFQCEAKNKILQHQGRQKGSDTPRSSLV